MNIAKLAEDLVAFLWRTAFAGAAILGLHVVVTVPVPADISLFFWGVGFAAVGLRITAAATLRRWRARRAKRASAQTAWASPDGHSLVSIPVSSFQSRS